MKQKEKEIKKTVFELKMSSETVDKKGVCQVENQIKNMIIQKPFIPPGVEKFLDGNRNGPGEI